MLYFIASSKSEKQKWKDAFLQVASDRGNAMLEHYHWGAYGSKTSGQWSCCNKSGMDAPGCQSITTTSRKYSDVSQTSIQSDDTLKSGSSTSSLRHSSSCSSGLSKSLRMDESYDVCFQLVNFDNHDRVHTRRSRAGTTESGIHIEARKQTPTYIDSSFEIESDTMSTTGPDIMSEDEGIESGNIKNDQGTSSAEDTLIPVYSYTLPEPLSAILLHQSILVLGINGILQLWDAVSPNLVLKTSLKIAGRVFSLDSWNDFIAVGSSVVQLIQLKPGADPKRMLYAKGRDRLQSPKSKFLVTFLGDDGRLASAKVGGNVIDIWAPPSADTQVVTKPESSIPLDDGTMILSLAGSKHPTHVWVAVLINEDGCLKLSILNIPPFSTEIPFVHKINEGQENSDYSSRMVNINGICIVPGNKKKVSLIDKKTGQIARSITLVKMDEDTLSRLSFTKGVIMVETADGKVMILPSDYLTKQGQLKDKQSEAAIVACATEKDCRYVYVVHENGLIKAWNAQSSLHGQLTPADECLLGMLLCSEGILANRQIIPINDHNDLSLPLKDIDAHLQLPEEVLDLKNPTLEVAFAPFGPGIGSQFVLPKGAIPVSPAVWLCFSPQKRFNNPAILKLPHCRECKIQGDTKHLQFLKAEHDDISRDKSGQIVATFKPLDKPTSKFPLDAHYGTLEDNHFCIYCLAEYGLEEDVIGKINYCLTILMPTTYPKDENTKIYCILHLDLEGCRKLVKEQAPEGYIIEEKLLQFNIDEERYDSALEISLDKQRAEDRKWMITLQSENKIYAEDVNFFNYRNPQCLTDACKATSPYNHYPYVYPPRFTLEVSSIHALFPSLMKLTFTGAKHELPTEIQLDWPKSEQDLLLEARERGDSGYSAYWANHKTPAPFTSPPND